MVPPPPPPIVVIVVIMPSPLYHSVSLPLPHPNSPCLMPRYRLSHQKTPHKTHNAFLCLPRSLLVILIALPSLTSTHTHTLLEPPYDFLRPPCELVPRQLEHEQPVFILGIPVGSPPRSARSQGGYIKFKFKFKLSKAQFRSLFLHDCYPLSCCSLGPRKSYINHIHSYIAQYILLLVLVLVVGAPDC